MSSDARDPNDPKGPESRRSTLRMRSVQVPPSRPSGTESETYGRIHRMVTWLDANKGAFAISRLISQTGTNIRSFGPDTKDDARLLSKLWPLLDVMLSPSEREGLIRAMRGNA